MEDEGKENMDRLTVKATSGFIHLKDNRESTVNVAIKKLSDLEDLEEQCIKENLWGLRMLLYKWKEFIEDIQELYEYRKLEKQNKLLKLPCTVDDTVFYLFPNDDRKWYIDEMKVCFISMQENQKERMICDIYLENNDAKAYADLCDFGKMVFLTREEAEAALKEMSE